MVRHSRLASPVWPLPPQVWPADNWGTLVFFAVVGPLAERVGYRTVIMGGVLLRLVTRLLLLFATGVPMMAIMQVGASVFPLSLGWGVGGGWGWGWNGEGVVL